MRARRARRADPEAGGAPGVVTAAQEVSHPHHPRSWCGIGHSPHAVGEGVDGAERDAGAANVEQPRHVPSVARGRLGRRAQRALDKARRNPRPHGRLHRVRVRPLHQERRRPGACPCHPPRAPPGPRARPQSPAAAAASSPRGFDRQQRIPAEARRSDPHRQATKPLRSARTGFGGRFPRWPGLGIGRRHRPMPCVGSGEHGARAAGPARQPGSRRNERG